MSKQRLILLFLPLVAFLLTAFLALHEAQAATRHNIRGLASSSQGYISFNCLDDDFFGKFPMMFPFYFNVSPCTVSDHGVHLDENNRLSGSAWSPALGYIYFNSSSTLEAPNYGFNSGCLKSSCTKANECIACYNPDDQRVYGWAYRHSTGEWIDLDIESPPVAMTNFSNPQPGIFSGYASSSFGQISFNCLTDNTCGINDYKVYMWKLELQEMSAPNWSFAQACSSGARRVVFKWVKKSGIQTAYRVVVSTQNSTSSGVVLDTLPIGGTGGGATQLVCPGPNCSNWTPSYNTSYYWWLQLWDENNQPTELFQFNTSTYGRITDNNLFGEQLTFTTYRHEFPSPLFVWSPPEVVSGTTTNFTSNARYYPSAGSPSQPCVEGGACGFLWTISSPDYGTIDTPTSSATGIYFRDNITQSVTLAVTDHDNYTCSTSSPFLTINFQLPIWKEVKSQ
jgi:hypothetical protein